MKYSLAIALTFFCALPANGQEQKTLSFLQLSEGQRYFYLEGAYKTVAHLLFMRDRKLGQCAADWWLKDRDGKRALVERTIAAHPDKSETTVILGLLTKACGPLVPKS